MLAHGAVTLQSQIFTEAQLEAIARDYRQAGLAPAEVAMMAFAEKVAGPAYTVTSADVESLRRHGFSDTDVLDIAFAARGALLLQQGPRRRRRGAGPGLPEPRRGRSPRPGGGTRVPRGALKGHAMAITRKNIQPEALAAPSRGGHTLYSHVVTVEGRRMIFVAGQLARDRSGNVVGKGDMRAQIRQVGENIKAALAAAGASLPDLVKTNTFVTDMDEYFRHVDVRMEYFGPALPTSTTVEVRRLAHPDFLVEIEAVAMTG